MPRDRFLFCFEISATLGTLCMSTDLASLKLPRRHGQMVVHVSRAKSPTIDVENLEEVEKVERSAQLGFTWQNGECMLKVRSHRLPPSQVTTREAERPGRIACTICERRHRNCETTCGMCCTNCSYCMALPLQMQALKEKNKSKMLA